MMFTNAIVRTPCKELVRALSSRGERPDYETALRQHAQYVETLKKCGLEVTLLDSDNRYPDSTFVEDTALLTPHCAIIMNPGAPSRKGEIAGMEEALKGFFGSVEHVREPGTADGGDIVMVGTHAYIGLSRRTNAHGAQQVISILEKYALSGSTVTVEKVLHLKSGVSCLGNNDLVASGEFVQNPEFRKFKILNVADDESYAANCVWINGNVLIPKGYPKATKMIEKAGYETIEIDVSEFRKVDGGISCLSLRF